MMYNLCDEMDRILCVFVEFSVRVQNSPSNQMLFRRISSQVSLEKGFIVSSCTARCQQHKSEWMGSLRVPCITSSFILAVTLPAWATGQSQPSPYVFSLGLLLAINQNHPFFGYLECLYAKTQKRVKHIQKTKTVFLTFDNMTVCSCIASLHFDIYFL